MHPPQRLTHPQKQRHELLLWKFTVIHQVGIDHILEITPLVIRQQHIHRLRFLSPAPFRRDAIIDRVDYPGGGTENLVGFHLLHRLGDGLGTKRAADLFQGVKLVRSGEGLD
ncbi:hypothetical protein QBC36DRAFT_329525 [Triangularia setosa]|uniref:Uncharacterized protein n=1 Tax=Triangularia setosa TaxID=2587417 RepID=A0AAN7A7Q3_9PEZI|nr:hypothetical protein QBC36DRAFT_329525 [Podospora setosa]